MTELHVSPLTPEVLASFARASGDDNPLHRDLGAARAAGLTEIPAHGMLSMAFVARLATTERPHEDLVSLTVRFVAPTPLGAAPVFLATRMDAEQVVLEGRLPDGTITLRGLARYSVLPHRSTTTAPSDPEDTAGGPA